VVISNFVLAANLAIGLEYVLALIIREHFPFILRQPTLAGHSVFRKPRAFNLFGGRWHLKLQSAGEKATFPQPMLSPAGSEVGPMAYQTLQNKLIRSRSTLATDPLDPPIFIAPLNPLAARVQAS
jgi:hypothetical protein